MVCILFRDLTFEYGIVTKMWPMHPLRNFINFYKGIFFSFFVCVYIRNGEKTVSYFQKVLTQVAQNVFITFYLGCTDVIKKRFEKNIFKTFAYRYIPVIRTLSKTFLTNVIETFLITLYSCCEYVIKKHF